MGMEFTVSKAIKNYNFVKSGDSTGYTVFVNGEETSQKVTSLSFNANDIVRIEHDGEFFLPDFSGDFILSFEKPLPKLKSSNFNSLFKDCKTLEDLGADFFINNDQVTQCTSLFEGCIKLEDLPTRLFVPFNKVLSFARCFAGCTSLQVTFDNRREDNLFDESCIAEDFTSFLEGCILVDTLPHKNFLPFNTGKIFDKFFKGCVNYKNIDKLFFANSPNLESAKECFMNTAVTTIPETLFDFSPKLKSLDYCFANTNLTLVSELLFENCSELESVKGIFSGCSMLSDVDSNVFEFNTKLKDVSEAFSSTSIRSIHEKVFKNCPEITTAEGTFRDCKNLTEISEEFFYTHTNLKSVKEIFKGCSNLTKISVNLFSKNTNLTDVSYAFANSGIKEIPENLFAKCKKLENVEGLFDGAVSISEIPTLFLRGLKKITNCKNLFRGLNKITKADGLFKDLKAVKSFEETFSGCTSLKEITDDLFSGCEAVETVRGLFLGCNQIENLPNQLFFDCPKILDASRFLEGCFKIKFISDQFFTQCHLLENMDSAFKNCTSLSYLPDDLFNNNCELSDFTSIFEGCLSLVLTINIYSNIISKAKNYDKIVKRGFVRVLTKDSETYKTLAKEKTKTEIEVLD